MLSCLTTLPAICVAAQVEHLSFTLDCGARVVIESEVYCNSAAMAIFNMKLELDSLELRAEQLRRIFV